MAEHGWRPRVRVSAFNSKPPKSSAVRGGAIVRPRACARSCDRLRAFVCMCVRAVCVGGSGGMRDMLNLCGTVVHDPPRAPMRLRVPRPMRR
jgi:hypothetical protein